MSTLLDFPDEIAARIVNFVGFPGILSLHQVCHDLRNFIDDTKPDWKLDSLNIIFSREDIIIRCIQNQKSYTIKYEISDQNGLLRDLGTCMKFQKSALKTFTIIGQIPEDFHLKLGGTIRTKTQKLNLQVENQDQILHILPCFNSDVLKDVDLSDASRGPIEKSIKIDKVVELEQWKKARNLSISCFLTFLSSSTFRKLTYKSIDDSRFLSESLGPFYTDPYEPHELNWYFRYPNSEECLRIIWTSDYQVIVFQKERVDEMPDEAALQN
ncbi:hypothetical protein CAEBREN_25427 [Caenorhabditis brenneri]|uniref:F-box domain-containing protein n=1 Tax=Caenorhabditis brenneri TaxID=135651 RepID=G0PMH6_CAEBE|nr:hypothetical protein CAEBREN_25427 [Caenorhabditis brenneri]